MGVAAAGLALGALGTVVSAFGQVQAGQAAAASAGYQRKVAEFNASQADRRAQEIEAQGRRDALIRQRQIDQTIGTQRTALAATGVDISTGSALDTVTDTAGLGAEDVTLIRQNAARDAYSERLRGYGFEQQGELARTTGINDRRASYIGAAGSILQGGSQVAGSWYKYNSGKP